MPERIKALTHWLQNELALNDFMLKPASADASFRRYFRITHDGASYIAMDAPPENEDCRPFIKVAKLMLGAGLHVPEIIDEDLEQGFLLLSDLGSEPYLDALSENTVDSLYGDALGALATIQSCIPIDSDLPPYDKTLLMKEMELFREWLIGKHLGITLDKKQNSMLDEVFELLANNALAQPQVCVHRDYHSRNLMVTKQNNPGIIDFQDAVIGPVTYDLVSLLRDCYIQWPREQVEDWVRGYHELALQSGILREEHDDPAVFLRWFDLMGVQRHLKAAGIFARLKYRDGKPGYLDAIPRTLSYVVEVAGRTDGLGLFGEFVEAQVLRKINRV